MRGDGSEITPVVGSMLRPLGRVCTPLTTSVNVPVSASTAVTLMFDDVRTVSPSKLIWFAGGVNVRAESVVHRQGDAVAGPHEGAVHGAGRERIDAVRILGGRPRDDAGVDVDAQPGRQARGGERPSVGVRHSGGRDGHRGAFINSRRRAGVDQGRRRGVVHRQGDGVAGAHDGAVLALAVNV